MEQGARWRLWAALAPIVAALGAAAGRFWFVCDDAYISFRYARHLAEGAGLRYNLGESPPVEGYSNLLWVLAAAAVEAAGGSPADVLPAVSVGLGAAVVITTALAARRMGLGLPAAIAAAVTVAASPGVVVWSTSGLETMAETLLLLLLADRLLLADARRAWPAAAIAGVLLCLVRTEGVAWALLVVALGAIRHRGPALRAGAVIVAASAAYAAWRLQWFGSLVSNVARVKVAFGAESVEHGADYVLGYWLATLAPPLQLVAGLLAARGLRPALVVLLALAVPAYAVVVGGDFMTMGRLLVPGAPFLALGVALAVDRLGAAALAPALLLAALGVQPLLNTSIVPVETLRAFRVRYNTRAFRTEYEQWTYMRGNARAWVALGEALHQLEEPGDSIVLGAIGAVGYHTELTVYDRFGLVSPEVLDAPEEDGKRRSPGHERAVPISFFLPHEPTVLRAELASPTLTDAALLRRTAEWPRDLDIRTRWGPAAVPVVVDGRPRLLLMLLRSDEAPEQWRAWEERGRARPRELAEPAPP